MRRLILLLLCGYAAAQCTPTTPYLGLASPSYNNTGWNVCLTQNNQILDNLLSGHSFLTALQVSGVGIGSNAFEATAGNASADSGFGCQNGAMFLFSGNPNCVTIGAQLVSGNNVNSQYIGFVTTNGAGSPTFYFIHAEGGTPGTQFLDLTLPGTTPDFKIGGGASGPFALANQFCLNGPNGELCWSAGTGVPGAGSCTVATAGGLYSRVDAASDTTHNFYVCTNNAGTPAWTPK